MKSKRPQASGRNVLKRLSRRQGAAIRRAPDPPIEARPGRDGDGPRLAVDIFQLVDDSLLKANRDDGSGWEWCWADLQRDWMDATPSRHAYRCLPLTIANQTGWWIRNPVGFSAVWGGRPTPGDIAIEFDAAGDVWKDLINNQFGEGILTWNTPFLFRTRPEGSRLLICGPANYFLRNAHPLTAIIESDWMAMSFTMNWKIMDPGVPARFDAGIPLFQAIPLLGNVCANLETASVTYRKLADDPDMSRAYNEWRLSRSHFHGQKARGEVKGDAWQKDYFHGRDISGREAATAHSTKVRPPVVHYAGSASPSRPSRGDAPVFPESEQPMPTSPQPPTSDPRPQCPAGEATHPDASLIEPAAGRAPGGDAGGRGHARSMRNGRHGTGLVDDEWRRWIAENLLLDEPRERIVGAMVSRGIEGPEAEREVDAALRSPYIRGSERLRDRLRKRDWLLACYRKLNRLHPASGEVERRDKLPRSEFLEAYYSTNRPVIITGMMDDWPAMQRWSLDSFAERFGDRPIEVQAGRDAGDNYETEREKFAREMPFAEFIEKVRTAGVTNDFYLTANNNTNNKAVLAELWDDIGQLPEYLDGRDRMAGFFWFGPTGTITPFHHDLTNNLMAQVVGRKRVKIAPSWDMPLMANDFHVFSRRDGRVLAHAPRPDQLEPQVLECTLNPGEILFLPIGCLHFVEGLDISVTMSFTNFLFDNDFSSFYSTYRGV
ncbi:DUF6065 family protein [Aquisphaera insulae]|uniref:DUF6065 family protein n=1 Tax=Aquisphaera insulae TaxID=2712864 RepID=UPI00202F93CC|nr:DUF6065 family protein [Aquisphaera insulae]